MSPFFKKSTHAAELFLAPLRLRPLLTVADLRPRDPDFGSPSHKILNAAWCPRCPCALAAATDQALKMLGKSPDKMSAKNLTQCSRVFFNRVYRYENTADNKDFMKQLSNATKACAPMHVESENAKFRPGVSGNKCPALLKPNSFTRLTSPWSRNKSAAHSTIMSNKLLFVVVFAVLFLAWA